MEENPCSHRTVRGVREIQRHRTGIVIPVYLPEGVDGSLGRELLEDTAEAYCAQVSDPSTLCLSVDGPSFGAAAAEGIAQRLGTSICVAPINKGKLAAAIAGARVLLANPGLDYLAIVDQDGDHFANELLNMLRAAEHMVRCGGKPGAMILGRRMSRHRPMGFFRGELEELADRVLLDALLYRAAVTGRPLSLEYAGLLDEFPDFHSGYKVFSRSVAQAVFLGEPRLAGVSESCYYRHACEAVMVVEAIESGACLGAVNRTTFNEQPISTFRLMDLSQLVADKIVWPCKRLGIPLSFAEQWMANHAPKLLLGTLPRGKEELERIKALVIGSLAGEPKPVRSPNAQPLFI